MIAEVIPYTRTIRGKDFFDYAVPQGMNATAGMIVSVPFRGKHIPGLIRRIKTESSIKKLQAIDAEATYSTAQPDTLRVQLVEWFSEYYFVSMPHAWKTLQYPLLKRPKKAVLPTVEPMQNAALHIPKKHTVVIQKAVHTIPQEQKTSVLYNHRDDCLALYSGLAQKITGNILIIVPEYSVVREIAAVFSMDTPVVAFTQEPSPSQLCALESQLTDSTNSIVIGTKKMLMLSPVLFSLCILDQEEARMHKQFDANPRYHTRTVVEKISELYSQTIVYTSFAPTAESAYAIQKNRITAIDIRRPWNREYIEVVDMGQKRGGTAWFSERLLECIQQSKKTLLFLNRIGQYSVAVCSDCGELLDAQANRCPQCHGSNMKQIRKGTKQLEEEIQQLFPKKRVVRVDREGDASPVDITAADIVIGTEKILSTVPLNYFDSIGLLSVDHLLVYPHFRSFERTFQLLTRFCIAGIPLLIQTYAPQHFVIRTAVQNNYALFIKEELQLRKTLHLPPQNPQYTLIDRTTRKQVTTNTLPATIPPTTLIERV